MIPSNIHDIADRLRAKYEDYSHDNKADPLEELIFIICSQMTNEKGYSRTYQNLVHRFPTHGHIQDSPVTDLELALKTGGMAKKKATILQLILKKIESDLGELSLRELHKFSDKGVELFLTGLPGVGLKTARCVMMYSLGRDVFPVDTHCWRISRRIGWVRKTRKDGTISVKDMNRLQERIPRELRFSLHVNFVSLGRDYCSARSPRCAKCPITDLCRKIGVIDKTRE